MKTCVLRCTLCRGERKATVHCLKRPVALVDEDGETLPTLTLWCHACKTKVRHLVLVARAWEDKPREHVGGETVLPPWRD